MQKKKKGPRGICTYSPQRRASACFVHWLEPCLAHRRDSVELLIVGGEQNFSPLVWKRSSRGLCPQLHGPINLDSLNQLEFSFLSFSIKNILIDLKLFTPLVSCQGPTLSCSLLCFSSLAPLPAALERPCGLWRCLLTLYPGSRQFQWSSRLPQSVTLWRFPTLLARMFSENPRFVYPVVRLCLSLRPLTDWMCKIKLWQYRCRLLYLFLVNCITINPKTCPLPHFLSHGFSY